MMAVKWWISNYSIKPGERLRVNKTRVQGLNVRHLEAETSSECQQGLVSGVSGDLGMGGGPASWDLAMGFSARTRETRIMRQYFEAN